MARGICKNCGQPIVSIDGWIHEDGMQQCAWQPPPLIAEPDTEGRYCA